MISISQAVNQRYATKVFDPNKKLSDAQFAQVKAVLQHCPSSVNSQPWHFIIAKDDAGKQRLAKGTQGAFGVNEGKVLNASHVILFCVKTDISDGYLEKLLDKEEQDGRYTPDPSFKEKNKGTRQFFTDIHRQDLNDEVHWMEKQVYLNIGQVLLAAPLIGVDAVPLEGIDHDALDQEFALSEKGFKAVAMVALGHHAENDFNKALPKSRLSTQEIFTEL